MLQPILQPRSQSLSIWRFFRHFEKYPEDPRNEVARARAQNVRHEERL